MMKDCKILCSRYSSDDKIYSGTKLKSTIVVKMGICKCYECK